MRLLRGLVAHHQRAAHVGHGPLALLLLAERRPAQHEDPVHGQRQAGHLHARLGERVRRRAVHAAEAEAALIGDGHPGRGKGSISRRCAVGSGSFGGPGGGPGEGVVGSTLRFPPS